MDVARADESLGRVSQAASPSPLERPFASFSSSFTGARKANTNRSLSQKLNNPFAALQMVDNPPVCDPDKEEVKGGGTK